MAIEGRLRVDVVEEKMFSNSPAENKLVESIAHMLRDAIPIVDSIVRIRIPPLGFKTNLKRGLFILFCYNPIADDF